MNEIGSKPEASDQSDGGYYGVVWVKEGVSESTQQWERVVAIVNEAIGLEWVANQDMVANRRSKYKGDFTHATTGIRISWWEALGHAQAGTTPPPF